MQRLRDGENSTRVWERRSQAEPHHQKSVGHSLWALADVKRLVALAYTLLSAAAILAMYGRNPRTASVGVYSIAEAKDKFSSLVKQAEEGEDVAITRYG